MKYGFFLKFDTDSMSKIIDKTNIFKRPGTFFHNIFLIKKEFSRFTYIF